MTVALRSIPGGVASLKIVLLCFSLPRMADALPDPASLSPPVNGSGFAPVQKTGGFVRAIDRLYHGGGRVGYLLYLDDQRFQLDLERDESVLSPYSATIGDAGILRRGCLYRGTVDSNPESLAVFNMCRGGLTGFFAVNHGRYKIRPIADANEPENDAERTLHYYTWERFGFEAVAEHESCGTREQRWRKASARQRHRTGKAKGVLRRDDREMHDRRFWVNFAQSQKAKMRRKRSVSRARHVELLLVADASMAKKYGSDLQHYLLTLASIASRLYGHASIENPVRLSVVKVTVLTENEKGLDVSKNAAATLKSFCKWQNQQNSLDDDHQHHHDAAILFTRQVNKKQTNKKTCVNAFVGNKKFRIPRAVIR